MMTLEEAIEHCDEKADCTKCGKEHKQLGEWLRELKRMKSGGTVTNDKLIAWLCGRFSADYVWTIEKLAEKVLEVCTEESDWTKVADCVECDGEAEDCPQSCSEGYEGGGSMAFVGRMSDDVTKLTITELGKLCPELRKSLKPKPLESMDKVERCNCISCESCERAESCPLYHSEKLYEMVYGR